MGGEMEAGQERTHAMSGYPERRNRFASCAALTLVLVAAAACAGGNGMPATREQATSQPGLSAVPDRPPAEASSGSTKVLRYLPSAPGSGIRVDGSCFARSIAAPLRSDGWRCIAEALIQDPCFAIDDRSVQCGMNPATGEPGFVLQLALPLSALNKPSPSSSSLSPAGWLVQLADGGLCQPETGATGTVDGKLARYTCSDGRWILGDLSQGDIWVADVVRLQPNSLTPISRDAVSVVAVWQ